ncbi:hypothetical protein JX266_008569 [Neoarthrinium moseri]|nr:hypothetical protein JX266_008569 [Neoarthrinium moseri]
MKDQSPPPQQQSSLAPSRSPTTTVKRGPQDWMGRSVYPHDAEDLKAHKWFRDIPWDRLQLIPPPFVPQISSLEDTHYFDEEEPISDWSESQPDTDSETDTPPETATPPLPDTMALDVNPLNMLPNAVPILMPAPVPDLRRSPRKVAEIQAALAQFPKTQRTALAQYVATPFDSVKLKGIDREIAHVVCPNDTTQAERLRDFVRCYGKRERKRPRDRVLRDRQARGVALEIRKRSAFLGYTWKRMKVQDHEGGAGGPGMLSALAARNGFNVDAKGVTAGDSADIAAHRAWYGRGVL